MRKERFEFVLKADDNIICQRFFKINNYTPELMQSPFVQIALRDCVELIKRDLNIKSNIYLNYVAPLIIPNIGSVNRQLLKIADCIFCTDEYKSYLWNGHNFTLIETPDEFTELITPIEHNSNLLTLTFIDNESPNKTIAIECWDANIYPKSIREKIDITNKRCLPFLNGYVGQDLVPKIIRALSNACSKQRRSKKVKQGEKCATSSSVSF